MDYIEVYKKRLNRYGLDYQSRIQGQRERDFENYLLKSIYRVDFKYDNMYVPATLERYKQDYTETQCYLLTRRNCTIPNGTMLEVESQNGNKQMWMVWWLEQIEASGYNKYVVLKMTHLLTWRDADKNEHTQWAYFSGPGTSAISDAIKSSSGEAIYKENNNLHMFITTYDKTLERDVYFENKQGETNQGYVVSEVDFASTPGVAYVSVDPSYIRDKSEKPTQKEEDNSTEFFWLNGGK
jgi:hypothetical protein